MVSTKISSEKPAKKTRSGGGANKRKLTPFNKFMQAEMQRLKEGEPELSHRQRFKLATTNWKTASENPKRAA